MSSVLKVHGEASVKCHENISANLQKIAQTILRYLYGVWSNPSSPSLVVVTLISICNSFFRRFSTAVESGVETLQGILVVPYMLLYRRFRGGFITPML